MAAVSLSSSVSREAGTRHVLWKREDMGGIVMEAGGADVFQMGRTSAKDWKFQGERFGFNSIQQLLQVLQMFKWKLVTHLLGMLLKITIR